MNQVTINESVTVPGINVYTGKKNTAIFHPAIDDTGIAFLVNNVRIPALLENAKHQNYAIALTKNGAEAQLVEHVLSSVCALGIDNLTIELPDGVVPTVNHCALEYHDALAPRRKEGTTPKKIWQYAGTTPWTYAAQGKPDRLHVDNAPAFILGSHVSYEHAAVSTQGLDFTVEENGYRKNIAGARPPALFTFATTFFAYRAASKIASLFGKHHGVTLRNYLIIPNTHRKTPLNMREKWGRSEFVRHKILDALGTLALTGKQFANTRFLFNCTGHKFDLEALTKLMERNVFTCVPAQTPRPIPEQAGAEHTSHIAQ